MISINTYIGVIEEIDDDERIILIQEARGSESNNKEMFKVF